MIQSELPVPKMEPRAKLDSSYYGSKKKLTDWIIEYIPPNTKTVLDGFSGGNYVSFALKEKGYRVLANDFLSYPYTLSKGLIENSEILLNAEDRGILLKRDPRAKTFVEDQFTDIYFDREKCQFVDSVYHNANKFKGYKRWLALAVLYRTIVFKAPLSRFNLTTTVDYLTKNEQYMLDRGLYGKYYRPINEDFDRFIEKFNGSVFSNGKDNVAYNSDIYTLLKRFEKNNEKIDVVYYDPPYCGATPNYEYQYHFVEGLHSYWKNKDIDYSSSSKRYTNMKTTLFKDKKTIEQGLTKLIRMSHFIPTIILSYNSKGYPKLDRLREIIQSEGRTVEIIEKEHKYEAPKGDQGNNIATEYLFVCK